MAFKVYESAVGQVSQYFHLLVQVKSEIWFYPKDFIKSRRLPVTVCSV